MSGQDTVTTEDEVRKDGTRSTKTEDRDGEEERYDEYDFDVSP